jgi:hypothetical protein
MSGETENRFCADLVSQPTNLGTNLATNVPITPQAISKPAEKPYLWKKGQSGNPGGRPKGLASMIREKSKDGTVLIDFLFSVVAGDTGGQTRDKIQAAQILLDRGFGKAVETQVQVQLDAKNGDSTQTLDDLADAQLESMARQLQVANKGPSELAPLMQDLPSK